MSDTYTDAQKEDCARREVRMRRRVYPKWVADGRMTEAKAAFEIGVMESIAADYAKRVQADEPELF